MLHTAVQPHHRSCLSPHRGGALPVIIVLVALSISAIIFFVFTRPAIQEEAVAEAPPPAAPVPDATLTVTPAPAKPKPPAAKPVPPAPPKPSFGFARPLDLGKDMVRSLNSGDYTRAGDLAAAAAPDQAKNAADIFKRILTDLKAKVGSEDQVELLGLVENKTRIALPLTLPGMTEPIFLQMDLERDDEMGWKISSLKLPKELSSALAAAEPPPPGPAAATAPVTPAMPGTPATKSAPDKAVPTTAKSSPPKAKARPSAPKPRPLFTVDDEPDALTFGSNFVRALLKHDFATASEYVDSQKVPAERLVGLCIVFEEGEYEFKPAKPLIITVANPEVSWVIAQVQSQKLQQSTEFGIEMQRQGIDQPWKVVGLNLSEILSSFASSAAKMGVPYTPIVNNPKGGESLALYFEYDQAELHPRAVKQLAIVAGMLKSDASKKLHIAGHTDAKGTKDYNLALSQARAESVKKQLAAHGVAPEQIVTTGLGQAQPLSPNKKADGTDDPEGRSKNRRAEIYLDF